MWKLLEHVRCRRITSVQETRGKGRGRLYEDKVAFSARKNFVWQMHLVVKSKNGWWQHGRFVRLQTTLRKEKLSLISWDAKQSCERTEVGALFEAIVTKKFYFVGARQFLLHSFYLQMWVNFVNDMELPKAIQIRLHRYLHKAKENRHPFKLISAYHDEQC